MTVDGTREALVRAGVELLEETGDADVGLRAIARRAGVSHGAPRRWFPTRRSLLAAIAEVGLADLAAALASAAERSGGDLVRVAEAYVEFAVSRPAMFTLVFRHDLLEGSGAELRTVSQPLFGWLVDMVEHAAGGGESEARAAALWVGVHGIAVLAATGSLELATGGVDRRRLTALVVRNSLSSR
ncbi:TetR/AcrR family transcriptional regulator [Rhodococcus hoagii]|nr:TetR/AcrR family transcriptional regulator [Prescottella equi]